MQARDIVGFIFLPLIMLIASFAGEIHDSSSRLAPMVLWFVRLIAYALLVLGGLCLLCQAGLSQIPFSTKFLTYITFCILVVGKYFWEHYMPTIEKSLYGTTSIFREPAGNLSSRNGHLLDLPDVVGFLVLLLILLVAPQAIRSRKPTVTAAPLAAPVDQPILVADR